MKSNNSNLFDKQRTMNIFIIGTLIGLILSVIFHRWEVLLLSSGIIGFFISDYRKGAKLGGLSILIIYTLFISYNLLVNEFMWISQTYLDVYGLNHLENFLFLILDFIAICIGVSGGYFGASISKLYYEKIFLKQSSN